MTLREWAIYYATAYSWFVFPIEPRGKRPVTINGFYDATNDPDAIAALWTREYNIGVDCGRSNLAVIDLDGAEGLAAWDKLQEGIAPRSGMVQFTGGGGAHILYRQPALVEIRNTAKKLAPHIDTRGFGGYILLAPSVHPSGNVYQWSETQCDFDAMETFPPELLPLLQDKPTPIPNAPAPVTNPPRTLQRSYERVANAPEGSRNDTLNRAAFYLFGLVKQGKVNESDVRDTLTAAAQRAGLAEREIISTLGSAYRAAG